MLDYRVETFLMVCETRNYTRAAKELNITQPAVSQHIKYLEEYFNVKLFEIRGKHIKMTSEGEEIYHLAKILKLNIGKFRSQLLVESSGREIRFGATRTIGEYILPPILVEYMKQYRGRNVLMEVDNANQLLDKIKYGDIDFAFVEDDFNETNFEALVYQEDNLICVGSKELLMSKNGMYEVDELFEYPLLLGKRIKEQEEFVAGRWLRETNRSIGNFKRIHVIENFSALKQAVEGGLGITFLYESAIKEELLIGRLVSLPIKNYDVRRKFKFVYRKNTDYEEEYIEFLRFCQDRRRIL